MTDEEMARLIKIITDDKKLPKFEWLRLLTPILITLSMIMSAWMMNSFNISQIQQTAFRLEFTNFKMDMTTRMATMEGFLRGREILKP